MELKKTCPECKVALMWYTSKRCVSCRSRYNEKSNQVRNLSPEEAAWIGAMVEGEGSILIRTRPCGTKQGLVQVCNSEVETVATCLRLVGAGGVYLRTPDKQPKHWKLVWFWVVTANKEVPALLKQITPYLTGKQDKAKNVIKILEQENSNR